MWPRWMDQKRGVLWIANLLSPVGADHELIVSQEQLVCSLSDRSYFLNALLDKSYVRAPDT